MPHDLGLSTGWGHFVEYSSTRALTSHRTLINNRNNFLLRKYSNDIDNNLPTTSISGLIPTGDFFLGAKSVVNRSRFSKVSPGCNLGSLIVNVPVVLKKCENWILYFTLSNRTLFCGHIALS